MHMPEYNTGVAEVFFVRNGEALKLPKEPYGHMSPLSDKGIEQAKKAAEILKGFIPDGRPDIIFCGPTVREEKTAAHVVGAAGWSVDIETVDAFTNMRYRGGDEGELLPMEEVYLNMSRWARQIGVGRQVVAILSPRPWVGLLHDALPSPAQIGGAHLNFGREIPGLPRGSVTKALLGRRGCAEEIKDFGLTRVPNGRFS